MFATYCTNAECAEWEVAKEVRDPDEHEITCGTCGHTTSEPAEVTVAAGESVR